jgi:hypothetical protein
MLHNVTWNTRRMTGVSGRHTLSLSDMRFLWRMWWRLQLLAGRRRSFNRARISVLIPSLATRDALVKGAALACR